MLAEPAQEDSAQEDSGADARRQHQAHCSETVSQSNVRTYKKLVCPYCLFRFCRSCKKKEKKTVTC